MIRGRRLLWLALASGLAIVVIVALWPVETFRGVNFQVSSRRIRLYEKVADFISRDLQTRRLIEDILGKPQSGEQQAITIFNWVTAHVRPTPEGFPVIDDHPLHIIIRGYGAPDQRTEAFGLLASYAGMASTKLDLRAGPQPDQSLMVALTEIHGTIYAFDVCNNIIFRDRDGALVSFDNVVNDRKLMHTASRGIEIGGVPYEDYFSNVQPVANFARMEMQKPWGRLRIELSKLVGLNADR